MLTKGLKGPNDVLRWVGRELERLTALGVCEAERLSVEGLTFDEDARVIRAQSCQLPQCHSVPSRI